MPKDLILDIAVLLREHEENRVEGVSIDARYIELALMAGRIIAAVRHHDEMTNASQHQPLAPNSWYQNGSREGAVPFSSTMVD